MGVIEIFVGMGKNFRVCGYAFLFIWKLQVNEVCQKYLLYTSYESCGKGFLVQFIRNLTRNQVIENTLAWAFFQYLETGAS